MTVLNDVQSRLNGDSKVKDPVPGAHRLPPWSWIGSYYLTYHRWARMDQLETAHPQFRRFMDLKSRYDPTGLFDSDWYRHYRDMLI